MKRMTTMLKYKDYHSALTKPLDNLSDELRFEVDDSVAFVWDICEGLPKEYEMCDIIYSDLSWKDGYEKFKSRIQNQSKDFEEYLRKISQIIQETKTPIILVTGKHAEKILPKGLRLDTKLNGGKATAYIYNMDYTGKHDTTLDILEEISTRYNVGGDFCCGYGNTGRAFVIKGKSFVMSDINGKCIGYIKMKYNEWKNESIQ